MSVAAFVAGAILRTRRSAERPYSENGGTDFDRATIAAFDAIAACPIPTLRLLKAIALAAAWVLPPLAICAWHAPIAVSVFLPVLAPSGNATHQLARLVGVSAGRIIFTAANLNVDEALHNGLITLAATVEDFEAALAELVAQFRPMRR